MSKTFGKLLQDYREAKGLGLRELAKRASVHFATLNKAELGHRPLPPKDITKLASALGLNADQTNDLWTSAFLAKVYGDKRLMPYYIHIEDRFVRYAGALLLLVNLCEQRGMKVPESVIQLAKVSHGFGDPRFG